MNKNCELCKYEIRLDLRGDNTQSEWYARFCSPDCFLNGVEDNADAIARRIESANKKFTMPEESEDTKRKNAEYDKEHFKKVMYWNE